MARHAIFVGIFILICSASATAENEPNDTRETWRIGVAEFQAIGLSPENLYVGSSYPLLIHEGLTRIDTHRFTALETEKYRATLVNRERKRLTRERDALLVEGDEAYLAGAESRANTTSDRLADVTEALANVSTLDQMLIEVTQEKPAEMVLGDDRVLLPRVVQDPSDYAEEKELDLLIYGLIEEIEGYLFADVYLFTAALGEVSVYQTGFSREWLIESSKSIFDDLVETALGREWAELRVLASPESAEIHIDGAFRGLGEVHWDFAEPGEHEITIKAYGFEDYSTAVTLEAGDTESVQADLLSADREGIDIVTVPAGADVYALSQWYGTTPVQAPPGMEHLQGLIRKEGYSDYLLPVLPSGQDEVSIRLLPTIIDREGLMAEKRSDFYRVFAAFVLSLPLPIYFFDATNTLTLSYLAEAQQPFSDRNLDEALRLFKLRQVGLSVYISTVFISVALFADAVVELLRFIDLANLSTY
jgi:hypothetical protein